MLSKIFKNELYALKVWFSEGVIQSKFPVCYSTYGDYYVVSSHNHDRLRENRVQKHGNESFLVYFLFDGDGSCCCGVNLGGGRLMVFECIRQP